MQDLDQGEPENMTGMYCVTLYAPSGSGKSQLAKAAAEFLGSEDLIWQRACRPTISSCRD